MKWLSYNYRGMGSSPKKLALHKLFDTEDVDIIMLQETLGEAEHITRIPGSLKPGWKFLSLDAFGQSGDLAIGYNPYTINIRASWGGISFIGMDIFSAELGMDLRVINMYGPCQGQEAFWNQFLSLSITSSDNLIIGGVLNLSLGYGKSWGSQAQVDPLTEAREALLDQQYLTDVPMIKPLPTWRNRRVREASLARRLDIFLIKAPLLQKLSR